MAVKEGYKQTEVGVIPEDWEVRKLRDISSMKSGNSITAKGIKDFGKYPCYGGNGLRGYTHNYTHKGEFALVGRQGALCGNVQYVEGIFFASEHAVVVEPYNETDIKWLSYVLKDMNLNQYSESSAQPGLSVNKILELKAMTPKVKTEQHAIATALSDIDGLINSITKLIEKKKNIKQGAMQNLLTGKKRLDGFSGEWVEQELSSQISVFSGGTPKTENRNYYGGNIPWITSSDLNKKYIHKVENYITEMGLENSSSKIVNKETLLLALYGATAGVVAISAIQAAINQAVLAINTTTIDIKFLFYWFTLKKDKIVLTFTQGGQPNLSSAIIKALSVYMPRNIKEQTAIATILSDMESEIETLQVKLNKYKAIKQGMMQELLTGRIRLLEGA